MSFHAKLSGRFLLRQPLKAGLGGFFVIKSNTKAGGLLTKANSFSWLTPQPVCFLQHALSIARSSAAVVSKSIELFKLVLIRLTFTFLAVFSSVARYANTSVPFVGVFKIALSVVKTRMGVADILSGKKICKLYSLSSHSHAQFFLDDKSFYIQYTVQYILRLAGCWGHHVIFSFGIMHLHDTLDNLTETGDIDLAYVRSSLRWLDRVFQGQ